MDTIYLYTVHPKKIIKELPTLPIRRPKSLYLDKDQVAICLKYGSVYRRFANENRNERVTISNLDRLHNEKFMTEEEFEKFKLSKIADNRGSITNGQPVVPAKDEQSDINVDEEKVEEVKVEETATTNEQTDINVDETVKELSEQDPVTNAFDPTLDIKEYHGIIHDEEKVEDSKVEETTTSNEQSDINVDEEKVEEVKVEETATTNEDQKKETSNSSNKYGGKNNKHRR